MSEQTRIYKQGHVEQTKASDKGYVRSVGLVMPQGFVVSGVPVTDRGIINVGFDGDYQLMSPADRNLISSWSGMFSKDASGKIVFNGTVKITNMLLINPDKVTDEPPNLWIDKTTGEIMRTTYTGDIGGGGSTGLDVTITLNRYSAAPGTSVTATASASGGISPYMYTFTVYNSVAFYGTSGQITSNSYTFTPNAAGTYYVDVNVVDGIGNTGWAPSQYLEVGSGTGSSLHVTAYASATSVNLGATVTFTASASGGTGNYNYQYGVFDPYANQTIGGAGNSITVNMNIAGIWYVEFACFDGVEWAYGNAPLVTVYGTGGGGGTPSSGTTTTTVRIRSRPSTNASTVTTLSAGTRVTITGSLVRPASDEPDQYTDWWPVRYTQYGQDEYNGYIRSDYLSV